MSAVLACRSGPGERPAPPFRAAPRPVHTLALTLGEARALLALADAGRVALDVDPRLLPTPGRRDAARRAVSRLRAIAHPRPIDLNPST